MNLKQAVTLMGREPINPIGSCFETAIRQLLFAKNPRNAVLCHGIGIANLPGQEGMEIGHAWVEADSPNGGRVAIDTTWGIAVHAWAYRRDAQLHYVREYTPEQAHLFWKLRGMPGPWDPRIFEITERRELRAREWERKRGSR